MTYKKKVKIRTSLPALDSLMESMEGGRSQTFPIVRKVLHAIIMDHLQMYKALSLDVDHELQDPKGYSERELKQYGWKKTKEGDWIFPRTRRRISLPNPTPKRRRIKLK